MKTNSNKSTNDKVSPIPIGLKKNHETLTHDISLISPSVRHISVSARYNRVNDLNIYYPICKKFIPRRGASKYCHCNRREEDHENPTNKKKSQLRKLHNEKWNKQIHTQLISNEAFGKLYNDASYVRIDPEIDLITIEKFLSEKWKFSSPKLIMSIIGGAQEFFLEDRLETKFIDGIVDVAAQSDIWIITNGYDNGLIQLVGQVIYKAKITKMTHEMVALGICKWGGVKNVHKLIKPEKDISNQQLQSDKSDSSDNDDDDDDEEEVQKRKEYKLNMDHTHYLMLDNGKYRNVDTEQYRTFLCDGIIKLKAESNRHIPAVTIVANGGDATISNIYHDLKANIPVVIIEGSGRIADFFSQWLTYTKDLKKNSTDDVIYEIEELKNQTPVKSISNSKTSKTSNGITETRLSPYVATLDLESRTLHDIFSNHQMELEQSLKNLLALNDYSSLNNGKAKSSRDITRLCDEIMYCLQPSVRSNITVFNLESDNDLSLVIFHIIAKSYTNAWKKKKNENEFRADELLELTMDWNCIDVAKEFALKNSVNDIHDIKKFFMRALKDNLFTFVFEFIRLGVNPVDIFFSQQLFFKKNIKRYNEFIKEMYSDEETYNDDCQLKYFIPGYKLDKKKSIESTHTLNKTLRNLIGSYMHKLYYDSFDDEDKDRIESGLKEDSNSKKSNTLKEVERPSSLTNEEKKQLAYDYIMRDLFLWCILTSRTDMAKVFLSFMKYRICSALIATKVFKQYHNIAPYGELRNGYQESATYFEKYAIDCLDKCDDHDAGKACEIVLQRNELYGYVTCLQVAADAKDQLFVAEPACVEAMNNIWYDKLHPNQSRKRDRLAIFFGIISLGILAPAFICYRESSEGEIGETPKPTLKSCGINYCDPYALEYPRYIKSQLAVNRFLHRLKDFHLSLLIKFCSHFLTYIFFLLLFSYVLLFQFNPLDDDNRSLHWTEILVIILVSFTLVEEIQYFFNQESIKISGKLSGYFFDLLKLIRFLAIILFYIGLGLRFRNTGFSEDFIFARIIMAIDIELWWISSLSFIIVFKFLGPQLVAIAYMLKDLLFFVCIIAIVMIGYGVSSRSMAYYPIINGFSSSEENPINPSFDGRSVFRQIISPVYFFLHGEFNNELDNLDTNRDAGWSIATHVIFAFHMLFVNILLTNLLIAMFSKRFERVYEKTRSIWHSQQYLFTRDYYMRAPFVPPFSFIIDIYRLVQMLWFYLRRKLLGYQANSNSTVFKMIAEDRKRIKEWRDFEAAATYEYAQDEIQAVFTNASTVQNSSTMKDKDDMINHQDNSISVLEGLREVQETSRKLTTSITELQQQLLEALKRNRLKNFPS